MRLLKVTVGLSYRDAALFTSVTATDMPYEFDMMSADAHAQSTTGTY
jgi:hypothetical protein